MKMDNFIEKKIRKNAAVKTNYRSDIDGQLHYIRGFLIGETERFFQIEGAKFHDVVAVPKSGVVSMIFIDTNEDQKPKPAVVPDPVIKRVSKKQSFSYSNWWKNNSIQETDK